MSQSEYEIGQEGSDGDYEESSEPRLRLRPGSRVKKYQPVYLEPKPAHERRLTRRKNNPLPKDICYNDAYRSQNHRNKQGSNEFQEDLNEPLQPDDQDDYSIFNVDIANIIWKKTREGSEEDEYLIKFKGRSYLHVQWLTEKELQETVKSPKNKINRFNKTFNRKILQGKYEEAIEEGKYFDPAFLEVDRILTTTELFPIIHQKKANEIKGKWSESLMIVCSKLLNFTRQKIHYGVLFCQPVNPERDNCPEYHQIIKQPMDLGTVLNKVYLDIYKTPRQFWEDIGLVWKNCLKFNHQEGSDLRVLGQTLRECTIFLYDQWYHLSEERYLKVKEQNPHLVAQENAHEMGDEKPDQIEVKPVVQELKNGEEHPKEQKMEIQPKQQEEIGHGNNQVEGEAAQEKNSEMKDENQEVQAQYREQPEKMDIQEEKIPQNQSEKPQNNQMKDFESQSPQKQEMMVPMKKSEDLQEQSSEKEGEKIEQQDSAREYLNMDEFYEKNIFLTVKNIDKENLTTSQELQLLNPGQFSYSWLDDMGDGNQFLSHSYEFIDRWDMKKLDLNVEVDRLFMVKWKNLSYSQATWEQQTVICCPEKIVEFKNVNKAMGRQARTLMQSQREMHIAIRDHEQNRKRRFTVQQINDMKNKLYFYDIGMKKQPHQYKSDNIPIYKNYKILRNYQLESLNWLIKSWYQRRNTILADEMGLGKTIQSIAFLYHLYSVENVKGPFLVIAPLSTLEHWKRTVEDWTPMNCVLYYDQNGNTGRRSIQYYEWNNINITMKGFCQSSLLNKFQVLITSYEVFMLDFPTVILDIPFQYVVVDEAHRLKNKNAKILGTLKQLPCKRVLLLTGTPIQNNTTELWSLLNYIHPEKFTYVEDFKRQFGDLSNNDQVESLNRTLKPYMLRRMKEDVEQSIPPLQETIIDVEMTNIQKTIYRALYEKNKNMLVKGISATSNSSYNTNLNNLEIQLRKCCNHPCLIKELQQDLLRECPNYSQRIEKIVNASGKMVLVKMLLEKCKREGKKVLIFSQFTHMLQLIEEFLKFFEYKYERIDGQIKAKERQVAIDRYNNPNKKRDVFLLSTKAGGVGINLTSANVVIIYDSDWNPQNDVQATARAHRIGQTSEVKVYRLVTSNTYETHMFERATQKLGLDKAIFIGGNFKQTGENTTENKLSKEEMETLLKKGILGFLDGQENQDFFDNDVDDIIAKNSRIAKYSLINGSCSFSKSKFVSNQSDNELKINDPNFWNIVLKNVQSPTQILLKKLKNLGEFKTVESQKQLMLDAAELMNNLIENKLSLSGFNTDDQINLSEFLTMISSQRQFHKHYRDLASAWLEEICKPSRRFKKMSAEDLEITKKPGVKKSSIPTRSNNEKGDIFGSSENEEEENQISQEKQKVNDQKKDELIRKICFLCENPKCTYYCKGYCKRAFHEGCKQKIQEGITNADEISGRIQPSQLCLDDETLKEMIDTEYICEDCKQNQVYCYICKKKGNYYGVEYQKSKKGKSKKDEQKEITPKNKRKNEVTKCSTANCSKYYHPKCIEEYDIKKHFKYIDANSLHFRCSLHYCDVCGVSGDTMSILQCIRCPKALHIRCMDKEKVLKISKKWFICDNHFKSKKEIKKTAERFNFASLKKNTKEKPQKNKKYDEQESEKSDKNDQEILHNYKTRRNRAPLSQEPPLAKVRVTEDKRPVRQATKDKLLTYQELNLTPISNFDYQTYEKDWCRYCGARYSSNFTKGPWGSKTLCTVHYINWNQHKILEDAEGTEKPIRPINPDSEQQLKYITNFSNKHPEMARDELLETLQKKNTKRNV